MFICQGLRFLISFKVRSKISSLNAGYDTIDRISISVSVTSLVNEQFSPWRVNVSPKLTNVDSLKTRISSPITPKIRTTVTIVVGATTCGLCTLWKSHFLDPLSLLVHKTRAERLKHHGNLALSRI